VIALCEKNNFKEAQNILKELIKKNPTNSEFYRIMGQIYSELGQPNEAIDSLINALRWDAKNSWALLMMGNVFARHKNDIETAMKYYDQSLKINPNDHIVVNNIGANFMQQGKLKEARKYFLRAIQINSDYPNTHYGLGMIANKEKNLQSSFEYFINAVKLSKSQDTLYDNAIREALIISKAVIAQNQEVKIVKNFLHKLEFDSDKVIEVIEDSMIPTIAKIELAENYNREKHILRYKPNYPTVQHLIMHELMHLELVLEARKKNLNQLFIVKPQQKTNFLKSIESVINYLNKKGISDLEISDFSSELFEGMNRLIYNTPIDLFIENRIYKDFLEIRPYQFLSLFTLVQEGLQSFSDSKITEFIPEEIISVSKIYNLVAAFQFKELFGVDLIPNFKASFVEIDQAKKFYGEFLKYKENKNPAIEYELVFNWAQELKIDKYFTLVDEIEYRTKQENVISPILNEPIQEIEMFKFQKSQEEIGTNMAIVMYMIGALEYFEGMSKDEIKKIAFEIAIQGQNGYNPDKKDYRLKSIPDKIFSGFQILAYYYVSWKLAIPEMLAQLQLPYSDEFKIALSMFKKDN
jgi:tetratricopeptide (TPR) repeat protein